MDLRPQYEVPNQYLQLVLTVPRSSKSMAPGSIRKVGAGVQLRYHLKGKWSVRYVLNHKRASQVRSVDMLIHATMIPNSTCFCLDLCVSSLQRVVMQIVRIGKNAIRSLCLILSLRNFSICCDVKNSSLTNWRSRETCLLNAAQLRHS